MLYMLVGAVVKARWKVLITCWGSWAFDSRGCFVDFAYGTRHDCAGFEIVWRALLRLRYGRCFRRILKFLMYFHTELLSGLFRLPDTLQMKPFPCSNTTTEASTTEQTSKPEQMKFSTMLTVVLHALPRSQIFVGSLKATGSSSGRETTQKP